jgi:hypothetical protein
MNHHDKIAALKNPKLNPYKLANPYDGLANSLHRWKTVANDAVLSHYTDEQKKTIASHYYDRMIAPMYGGMKIAPMSKELWLKQAYGEATNYNIEDAYNNSIMHSLAHGWNEGLPGLARAGQYVHNALGNFVEDAVQLYKNQTAFRALPDAQQKVLLARPWHEQAADLHNQIAVVDHEKYKDALDKAIDRGAQRQTDEHEFWAAALPNYDGWLNHATSFVAEQAAQLPMYVAMGEGSGLVKGGNLTAKLVTTTAGKRVFGYLMAGAEGYAYGTATRKQEDKGQAWQDAVGFAVFHGMFDVGGMGIKKLGDVVQGVAKDALEKRAARLELAQKGLRPATSAERYEDHKKEVGNNLIVAGIPGQQAIYVKALHHVTEMQDSGMSRAAVKEHEMKLLNEDPAQYAPVLSAATFVRSLLGDKKLSSIEAGSEDFKYLSTRLNQLVMDAGSSLNTHVEGVQEQAAAKIAKEASTPGTKRTLEFYKAKVIASLAKDPAAAKMVKPEQIEKMAQQRMAKDQIKAAAQAEKRLTQNPVKKATSIALKNKDYSPLPARLSKASPRYGYGNKLFELKFDDPRDLAAYVLSTTSKVTKSSAHDEFGEYYKKEFGDLIGVESHARRVRDFIKGVAKDAETDESIQVPSQVERKSVPATKVRTAYTKDRFGQPSVRYDVNPDYNVYLKKYMTTAKSQGKTLTEFFKDMSDEDFKDDLSKHFYPKSLQQAGIFFEHQNTREGTQNPNFLAFMYNYTHSMPREFGKELEQRLIDTMKVQKFMSGRKPSEPQLMYYAKAMYNHMDNFLGSGRWPQESNIFRSTQDDMWNSTEWQQELLQEKHLQERKNLKDMFSADPSAKRAALVAHKTLHELRMKEYAKGPKDMSSQERISDIDSLITDQQTQTGDYERWEF